MGGTSNLQRERRRHFATSVCGAEALVRNHFEGSITFCTKSNTCVGAAQIHLRVFVELSRIRGDLARCSSCTRNLKCKLRVYATDDFEAFTNFFTKSDTCFGATRGSIFVFSSSCREHEATRSRGCSCTRNSRGYFSTPQIETNHDICVYAADDFEVSINFCTKSNTCVGAT